MKTTPGGLPEAGYLRLYIGNLPLTINGPAPHQLAPEAVAMPLRRNPSLTGMGDKGIFRLNIIIGRCYLKVLKLHGRELSWFRELDMPKIKI
jgi:hypothetical protein